MTDDERRRALKLIWRHTHRDYKGTLPDGTRTVLMLREGGTCLVPLESLTEAELVDELKSAERLEQKRLEKRGQKKP